MTTPDATPTTSAPPSPRESDATAAAETEPAVPGPAVPGPAARGYGALWASVPRELGFLILTMPLAVLWCIVTWALFSTGVGLIAIVIGIFITVAALYVARGFGMLELHRLRWAGRPAIKQPEWSRGGHETSFWRATFLPFADGHYWLYLLHVLIVNPIVSVVTWSLTITWLAGSLGGLTAWLWEPLTPSGGREFFLHEWILERFFPAADLSHDLRVGELVFEFILGAVFLLTLPFVFRGLTMLHDVIARGLLGAWRSEALEREVVALAASRGAAVQAEDASLRRLERDIHDGPQQRLVRLQMDLAAIERRLDHDPEQAKALVGEARETAREALDELRALSRGFAPPLLQDRGLSSALSAMVARSPIPVTLEDLLPSDADLPASIERNAYFIAAELLTNTVKHADASAVRVRVAVRDTGRAGRWLDLWVTDNGRGGASLAEGHGLAGLDERVRGLRGMLVVESPVGGPTSVGAHIPYVPVTQA
ncbi:sensor histidine kinase [Agromyces sp. LHK192]|uniref:sensor histidine kinase n=1 Tax=Agromyces sp. LHK192 TaxID=2498704 RepID=UPI000FDBE2E3|nr:sensor histidine kinase [Agromyces sp. LHK192]